MTKKKEKIWHPTVIKGNKMQHIADWLNGRGDFNKHDRCLDDKYTIGKNKKPNHITEFGEGYNQAISDVYDKLGLDYKV